MKNLILVSVLLSAMSAYAGPNPMLTGSNDPYQVLKSAFDAAGPAQMSDFPTLANENSASPSMKCVSISANAIVGTSSIFTVQNTLASVDYGSVTIVTPGIPSSGPLFPGTPDQSVTSLSVGMDPASSDLSDADTSTEITSRGYSFVTAPNASGDLQTIGKIKADPTLTITDTYRKNGSELFIREIYTDTTNATPASLDNYGYCYPAGQ
jgi:hypothetical protein